MGDGLFIKSRLLQWIAGGWGKMIGVTLVLYLHAVKNFIQMWNDTVNFFDNIEWI